MRLFLGVDGFFSLSFPEKQVYWRVSENGRVGAMKQKKEREKRRQNGQSPQLYAVECDFRISFRVRGNKRGYKEKQNPEKYFRAVA